ncbi:MAG: hypothetical protein ACI39R_01300 [Lachnospiraceae bacterium]
MKSKIEKTLIILFTAAILTGCNNQEKSGKEDSQNLNVVATVTEAPDDRVTEMPTPTPVPEKLIELTDEQADELMALADSYRFIEWGLNDNYSGRKIVAYYSYLRQTDKELAVAILIDKDDAKDTFGGEWTDIIFYDGEEKGAYGKMTVARIEELLVSESDVKFFIPAVKGVEYSDVQWDFPPGTPFVEFLKFHFCYGDMSISEQDGVLRCWTSMKPA